MTATADVWSIAGVQARRIVVPIVAALLASGAVPAHAEPSFSAVIPAGGHGTDAPYRVSALPGGGAIVAGRFHGRAGFGRHAIATTPGRDAAFVARMRPSGSFAWATALAGTGHDIGLAVLPDGSSLVVGDFRHRVRIGATTLRSQGSYDAFVARLDDRGRVLWARRAGGWLTDAARGVAVRADGSALITGRFRGTATFGSHRLTSAGGTDVFVAAIGPAGRFAWARRLGGPGDDTANGIIALDDGTAMIAGRFTRRVDLGPRILVGAGRSDGFVAGLDQRGRPTWATGIGGPGDDTALGLAPRGGGAIVVGAFSGTASVDGSLLAGEAASSGFALRIDGAGRVRWSTAIAGAGASSLRGAATGPDGSTLVAGRFRGVVRIGTTELASAGRNDMLVVRLDRDGMALAGLRAGGPGDDLGLDIAVRDDGSALLAGRAEPGAAFGDLTPASRGEGDIAIATIAEAPVILDG